MKIILTRTEAVSNLTYTAVIDKALSARRIPTDETVSRKLEAVRLALDNDSIPVSELNRDYSVNEDGVCITFSDSRDLVIEIDEQMVVETTKIMTDNIDTIVGIGISIYGLICTFTGVFKKMGKRIEDAIIARRKQLNSVK